MGSVALGQLLILCPSPHYYTCMCHVNLRAPDGGVPSPMGVDQKLGVPEDWDSV